VATAEQSSCIGVTTVGSGHFWSEVKKGAIQAGKELGIDIYHRAPVDEINTMGQKHTIQAAINRGCTGFVIAPNTEKTNLILAKLKQQNIPTVYIDRDYGGERLSVTCHRKVK